MQHSHDRLLLPFKLAGVITRAKFVAAAMVELASASRCNSIGKYDLSSIFKDFFTFQVTVLLSHLVNPVD